ncbi:unnamed protein product [Dovyalis caffra]|uniref:Pentatricopeptide repeat-containing protein n=1 Tax=Dovyalis caffra TaxID=77055 RepID=A0AAV1SEE4_9ROSI|nr:unnamed protein product [Dovyalis caffra]
MRSLPWPKRLKPLLLACKEEAPVTQIHALVITTGLSTNSNSNSLIIASYARMGDITSARYVFDKLPLRGVDAWNSMIIAYSRRNYRNEVLNLYHQMIDEGVKPDSSIFTVAIKASSSLMALEVGEGIWHRAVDFGYGCDVFVASSVLNLYVKCGKIDEAKLVFDKMVKRDVVSWATMITGLVHNGKVLEAVDMFGRMKKEGIEGDGVVMLGLIQACAHLGDLKLGLSVHGHMVRREMPMNDIILQTSLVDMYAKIGNLGLASRAFKQMPRKNAVSWGALISGFAQNGFAEYALDLLVEMQGFRFKPDTVALVSALLACAQVGHLKLGKSIHGYIVRRLDFELVLGTALIDMYAKCGALSCAHAIFDRMDSRDLILWNTMIASYGIHGDGKEVLSLFLKMKEADIRPDHATFASLLSALSHSGQVDVGQFWFNAMVNECKIPPSEKHYACMVDLLSRAGRVEEAYQLIESMNTEPGMAIWVALLSGCHNCRNLLIGEVAAKKILELNPDDLGIYALVSNFFSMTRMWDKVSILRKTMKETGMKKVPGYSAVEVNGKHEAFLVEDKSHHQYEEIMQMLDSLDNEMRVFRYVPDTWHDPGGSELKFID